MTYTVLKPDLSRVGLLANTGSSPNQFWGDKITQGISDQSDSLSSQNLSIDVSNKNVDLSGNTKQWIHTLDGLNLSTLDPVGASIDVGYHLFYYNESSNRNYLMTVTKVTEDATKHTKSAIGVNTAVYDLNGITLDAKTFDEVTGTLKNIITYLFRDIPWNIRLQSSNSEAFALEIKQDETAQSVLQTVVTTFGIEVDAFIEPVSGPTTGALIFGDSNAIKRTILLTDELGSDKEIPVLYGRNMTSLSKTTVSDVFGTRFKPVGKDDLTISSVNDGNPYLTDDTANQQHNPIGWANGTYRDLTIKNTAITDPLALKHWAEKQVPQLNHPRANYEVSAVFSDGISLGDSIIVQDLYAGTPIVVKSRAIKIESSQADPYSITVTIGEFVDISRKSDSLTSVLAIANSAKTIAVEAQSSANVAQSSADTAQATASVASSSAKVAQSMANTVSSSVAAAVDSAVAKAQSMDSALNQSINNSINATMSTVNNSLATLDSKASSFKSAADSATSSVASSVSALMTSTAASLATSTSVAASSANKALSSAAGAASSAAIALSQAGVNSLATSSVASDVNGLNRSYTSLNSSAGVLSSQTASLAVSASSASAQFDKVTSSTGSLASETATLRASASSASAEFNKVNSTAGSLARETASLAISASSFSTSISSMSSENNSQSTAISTLTQRADGFDFTVSKVNNLSVGGRNLLLGTGNWAGDGTRLDKRGTVTDTSGTYRGMIIASSSSPWTSPVYVMQNAGILQVGKTYTFSTYVRNTSDTDTKAAPYYDGAIVTPIGTATPLPAHTDWIRVSITFTCIKDPTTSANGLRWEGQDWLTNGQIQFAGYKLEEGNVATDWTPAPEDIDAVTGSQSTAISKLTQRADGFDMTVAKVDNITVGGRNLFLNSKGLWGIGANGSGTSVTIEDYDLTTKMWHIKAPAGGDKYSGLFFSTAGNVSSPLAHGDKWAFGADIKGSGIFTIMGIEGSTRNGEPWGTIPTTWSRVSSTGVADNPNVLIMYFNASSTPLDVCIKLPKIELGTIPTAWTPAPEDTEAAFATQKMTIDGITDIVSNPTTGLSTRVQTAEGFLEQVKGIDIPALQKATFWQPYTSLNFNDYTSQGSFFFNTTSAKTNGPTTSTAWIYLMVEQGVSDNSRIKQTAWYDGVDGVKITYVRTLNSGVWSSWYGNDNDSVATISVMNGQIKQEVSDRSTGDSNTLTQAKDFTTSQITSYDNGIQSQFTQTTDAILAKISSTNLFPNSEFTKNYGYRTLNGNSSLSLGGKSNVDGKYNGTVSVTSTSAAYQGYWAKDIPIYGGKKYSASVLVHYTNGGLTNGQALLDIWFVDKDGSRISSPNNNATNVTSQVSNPYWVKLYVEGFVAPVNAVNMQVSLLVNDAGAGQYAMFTQPMVTATEKLQEYSPNDDISAQLSLMQDNFSFGLNSNGQLVSGIMGNEEQVTLAGKAIHLDGETTVGGDFYALGGNFKNLNASEIKTGTLRAELLVGETGYISKVNTGEIINTIDSQLQIGARGTSGMLTLWSSNSDLDSLQRGSMQYVDQTAPNKDGLRFKGNAIQATKTTGQANLYLSPYYGGEVRAVLRGTGSEYVDIHGSQIISGNIILNANHTIISDDGGKLYFAAGRGDAIDINVKTLTQSSLVSLKENIRNVEPLYALEEVLKADVRQYNFIGDDITNTHITPMIDNVNHQLYIPNDWVSDDGKSVDTYTIIGYLVQSVKELNNKITELENTNGTTTS